MLPHKWIKFSASANHLTQLLIMREVSIMNWPEVPLNHLVQRLLTRISIHLTERVIQILVLTWRVVCRGCVPPAIRCRIPVFKWVFILHDLRSLPVWNRTLKMLRMIEIKFSKLVRIIRITIFGEACEHNISRGHTEGVRDYKTLSKRTWILVL